MKDLIEFLDKGSKSSLARNLNCSKEELMIIYNLCINYVQGKSRTVVFDLICNQDNEDSKAYAEPYFVGEATEENAEEKPEAKEIDYSYLLGLSSVKSLFEKGYIKTVDSMLNFRPTNYNIGLDLLHADVTLSKNFLSLFEERVFEKDNEGGYANEKEYLQDEFMLLDLYKKTRFIDCEEDIKELELHIAKRLRAGRLRSNVKEIFKNYKLNRKEQLVVLSLLKYEYHQSDENEGVNILKNISKNEVETVENISLLDDDNKLVTSGLVEYEDRRNFMLDTITRHYYISEDILDIIEEQKKDGKINLKNSYGDKYFFELIKPKVGIESLILNDELKALFSRLIKQLDRRAQKRLATWGIKNSKEIAAKIIFHGPAGTGKTASALALAKSMKKEVLNFDCSKILSKWVGESEQNVRRIFDDYKEICEKNRQSPVLLLNEADQFLSTRTQESSGSDKMHNQMQNIFLEQIERFEGVLIATTNFLESLDTAFSRRFDYKIEFKRPNYEQRLELWSRFLPKKADFSQDFSLEELAQFDLSGAQIELVVKNTALKVAVSADGIFGMSDFREMVNKELSGAFDAQKKVGFSH